MEHRIRRAKESLPTSLHGAKRNTSGSALIFTPEDFATNCPLCSLKETKKKQRTPRERSKKAAHILGLAPLRLESAAVLHAGSQDLEYARLLHVFFRCAAAHWMGDFGWAPRATRTAEEKLVRVRQ